MGSRDGADDNLEEVFVKKVVVGEVVVEEDRAEVGVRERWGSVRADVEAAVSWLSTEVAVAWPLLGRQAGWWARGELELDAMR